MNKKIILLLCATTMLFSVRADEGMWLPSLIGKLKIKDMHSKGLKLSAEDLYSVNKSSLKDAIVLFGGGCTGEVVSDQGLLLTNHHCGYGQIQSHSSAANDLLTNGFWAMNKQQELPNPGLTVSFLVRMDDVTENVLSGVNDSMTNQERAKIINTNSKNLISQASEGNSYQISIEPLFYGNQYFMYIFEVFEDVRLVAAPPSSIGKFGGDTDNWMWPRHTGDFSVFRIYADKNNMPAKYSPDNVPYKPKQSLKISLGGVKEGDFTFVYGFPARTNEYLLSDEVKYIAERSDPAKIALRTKRLDIMNDEQSKDVATRIMYASKNAGVANAWKKWQGEVKGINRLKTVDKKEALEREFVSWSKNKPMYRDVVPQMKSLYTELSDYAFARDYFNESIRSIELFGFVEKAVNSISKPEILKGRAEDFYKDYSQKIDKRIAVELISAYIDAVPQKFQPEGMSEMIGQYGGVKDFVDYIYKNSNFADIESFNKLMANDPSSEKFKTLMKNDAAVGVYAAFYNVQTQLVNKKYREIKDQLSDLYRLYMKGLMTMQDKREFYPDANSTLRIAYGKIDGYSPLDAIYYRPFSTIEGIMQKDNPDIYDYNVPQKFRDIYATKDYGRWAVDGTVPVAFIASNHTTGGNSGSPVLNANGELLGLNFDRTWEGTMSDVEFSEELCRNISVDIRYVLFIIDRIGGAGYLIDEMKLK